MKLVSIPKRGSELGLGQNLFLLFLLVKIFVARSTDSYLRRVVTGYNQNALESLNQLIWKNTPKSKFHGSRRVTIAVGLAFLQFEKGGIGRVLVQQKLGIPLTEYQLAKVHVKDRQRVFHAERTLKKAKSVFEVAKKEAKAKKFLPTSPGYDSGACDTPLLSVR